MHITVYLGANCGTDPHLAQAVRELGAWIGAAGHTLVYGGSKTGLMGQLSAPCILYDLDGYYCHLKALLDHMISAGLSSPERQQGIHFAQNLPEIQVLLS